MESSIAKRPYTNVSSQQVTAAVKSREHQSVPIQPGPYGRDTTETDSAVRSVKSVSTTAPPTQPEPASHPPDQASPRPS